jgi:carnitine-CoA ligase
MSTAFDHMDLGSLLKKRASTDPGRRFVMHHDPRQSEMGESITYAACVTAVSSVQAALRDAGVQPGDRVLLYMESSVEHVVAFLAVVGMGAVAVPTNLYLAPDKLAEFVEGSCCSVVMTSEQYFPVIDPIVESQRVPVPVFVGANVVGARHARRALEPLTGNDSSLPGRRLALVLYTADTTGRTRGGSLSHATCLSAGRKIHEATGLISAESVYCAVPLFRVNAICMQLIPALLAGAQQVVVALVRVLDGPEARELADRPRPAAVHRRVDAPGEREHPGESDPVEVGLVVVGPDERGHLLARQRRELCVALRGRLVAAAPLPRLRADLLR